MSDHMPMKALRMSPAIRMVAGWSLTIALATVCSGCFGSPPTSITLTTGSVTVNGSNHYCHYVVEPKPGAINPFPLWGAPPVDVTDICVLRHTCPTAGCPFSAPGATADVSSTGGLTLGVAFISVTCVPTCVGNTGVYR